MSYIKAFFILMAYLFVGLPFALLMLPTAPFITSYERIRWTWINFDRGLCSFIHGTKRRTISGYTGEYALKYKRFRWSGYVIDELAQLFGDEPQHCYRAYLWEKRNNYIH